MATAQVHFKILQVQVVSPWLQRQEWKKLGDVNCFLQQLFLYHLSLYSVTNHTNLDYAMIIKFINIIALQNNGSKE